METQNHGIFSVSGAFLLILSLLKIAESNFIPDFIPNNRTIITSVPEGMPNGSLIRRLKGVDHDNDPLFFKMKDFVENENPFYIESYSKNEADVRIKMELDRENVSEYWIDLSLTDGRVPFPGNVQFLLVIVEDVNDNSPVFTAYNETFTVLENGKVPTQIAKVKATDLDEGPNGEVTYSFELDNDDDKEKFNMTIKDNWVTVHLLQSLDYEKKSSHTFRIVAQDCPLDKNLTRKTYANITVLVEDVDDLGPVFVSVPGGVVKVPEHTKANTTIFEVKARDGDMGQSKTSEITYEIASKRRLFTIDANTGVVKTRRTLEYDGTRKDNYNVRIKARERDSKRWKAIETVVEVEVLDLLEKPKFRELDYRAKIKENSPKGAPVRWDDKYDPEVVDNDKRGNGLITLKLDSDQMFEVFPTKGYGKIWFSLIVKHPEVLNYEEHDDYYVNIIATDESGNKSVVGCSITIEDENDNTPIFVHNTTSFSITENPANGTKIGKVSATDADRGYFGDDSIFYRLQFLEPGFDIDKERGLIIVTNPKLPTFDREKTEFITLRVSACDYYGKGNCNFTSVTIQLDDENDNAPVFSDSNYKYRVSENSKTFQSSPPISANDIDHDPKNRAVWYKIISGNSGSWLQIDPFSGRISIQTPFDFESLSFDSNNSSKFFEKEVNITLEAHDLGDPQQRSTVNLTLTIMDENDCLPEFTSDYYELTIREELAEGSEILRVSAVDRDITPAYNRVLYKMMEHFPSFQIDAETGVISLTSVSLDYFNTSRFMLQIVATNEDGLHQSQKNCFVNITIIHVNKRPPSFQIENSNRDGFHFATVYPNFSEGAVITSVRASDPDPGSKLRFSIAYNRSNAFRHGWPVRLQMEDYFAMDMDSVQAYVRSGRRALDCLWVDQIHMILMVEDIASETGRQVDEVWLIISVAENEEHFPKFLQDIYKAPVKENLEIGTEILTISARGSSQDSVIRYYIGSYKPNLTVFPFEVEPISGVVKLVDNVDYELTTSINFTIKALQEADGEIVGSSYLAYASVFIMVQDENDNWPVFTDSVSSLELMENVTVGTTVAKVHATDEDSGNYGIVTYIMERSSSNKKFSIDPITGEIQLIGRLDNDDDDDHDVVAREEKYELTVKAFDDYYNCLKMEELAYQANSCHITNKTITIQLKPLPVPVTTTTTTTTTIKTTSTTTPTTTSTTTPTTTTPKPEEPRPSADLKFSEELYVGFISEGDISGKTILKVSMKNAMNDQVTIDDETATLILHSENQELIDQLEVRDNEIYTFDYESGFLKLNFDIEKCFDGYLEIGIRATLPAQNNEVKDKDIINSISTTSKINVYCLDKLHRLDFRSVLSSDAFNVSNERGNGRWKKDLEDQFGLVFNIEVSDENETFFQVSVLNPDEKLVWERDQVLNLFMKAYPQLEETLGKYKIFVDDEELDLSHVQIEHRDSLIVLLIVSIMLFAQLIILLRFCRRCCKGSPKKRDKVKDNASEVATIDNEVVYEYLRPKFKIVLRQGKSQELESDC